MPEVRIEKLSRHLAVVSSAAEMTLVDSRRLRRESRPFQRREEAASRGRTPPCVPVWFVPSLIEPVIRCSLGLQGAQTSGPRLPRQSPFQQRKFRDPSKNPSGIEK